MAANPMEKVKAADNEILIIRLFDAPRKMVWEAWNDTEQAAQWWGPRGFTITTHSKDLRPGGIWHYTMHGPDGIDYVNKTQYLEVEEYSKLVYDHGGNDEKKPMFRVTVYFTDEGGKTLLHMTMALPSKEAAQETKKFIKKANGNSTWDRLAEYLDQKKSGKDSFVITRTFDAPIGRVFEMWTDPKHFAHWMGPKGSTMEFLRTDIKPGGSSFYRMSSPGGPVMYGKAGYREISKPNRLVYTQSFCDEYEKVARHPMAATWPETMLTTVTLAEEGPDRTRVTILWEVFGDAGQAERDTFHNAKAGMGQGWGGSLDQLEDYLLENQGVKK